MSDVAQLLLSHGGPVLFAVVFAEQAGLPLPSAPWLLAAGALAAGGQLNPVVSIGVTTLAAVMADSLWFYVGRRGGHRVLRLFCRLSLARSSCVGRTKGLFERHGLQALLAAKFLPGLGAVMPPLAGALGMNLSRFLLFDFLGSLVYGAFYFTIGFVFRNQLGQALALLNRLGLSALLVGLALVAGYIGFKYAQRRRPLRKAIRQPEAASGNIEIAASDPVVVAGGDERGPALFSAESLVRVPLPGVVFSVAGSPPQNNGIEGAAPPVPARV